MCNLGFLLLLSLVLSGCGLDFFGDICMGGGEYTHYTLDLHVVESGNEFKSFSITRKMDFGATDMEPEIHDGLKKQSRYSVYRASLLLQTLDLTLLNYGETPMTEDSVWINRHSYTLGYEQNFYNTDFNTKEANIAFSKTDYDTLQNPYTSTTFYSRPASSFLKTKKLPESPPKKHLSYHATFYDSSKYYIDQVLYPRYDAEDDIYFISRRTHFLITADSTEDNYFHNQYRQESWLVKYTRGEVVDSLFQLPENVSVQRDFLRIGTKHIAVSAQNSLSLFDYTGDLKFRISNPKRVRLNKEGTSLIYRNNKFYYRTSDQKTLNLTEIVNGISYAQPYEDYILVTVGDSLIHIIDSNTENIISSISYHDLPELETSPSKHSEFSLHFPVLTGDNRVRLLYADLYYYDDPEDPCD